MPLSYRFEDALLYAAQLHASQVRKGSNVPYIAHLLGVAAIALEHGADEDTAIAALLHDAIEDQGGHATRQELRRRFGERVTDIVDGCTDTDQAPKPPWRARKEAYLARLPGESAEVRLVSAADKLYNARSILEDFRHVGEELWGRFSGSREGTLWYYRALVTAYRQSGTHPRLVDELDRTVCQIEELAGAAHPR
jgi:(p)ppGpp synthase/HD superfamily hydrolase